MPAKQCVINDYRSRNNGIVGKVDCVKPVQLDDGTLHQYVFVSFGDDRDYFRPKLGEYPIESVIFLNPELLLSNNPEY